MTCRNVEQAKEADRIEIYFRVQPAIRIYIYSATAVASWRDANGILLFLYLCNNRITTSERLPLTSNPPCRSQRRLSLERLSKKSSKVSRDRGTQLIAIVHVLINDLPSICHLPTHLDNRLLPEIRDPLERRERSLDQGLDLRERDHRCPQYGMCR